jgi:hypothetical protein
MTGVIRRRPARRRGPRHQAAASIAVLPAGCTRSSSSGVGPVPTRHAAAAILDAAGRSLGDVVGDGRLVDLEPLPPIS